MADLPPPRGYVAALKALPGQYDKPVRAMGLAPSLSRLHGAAEAGHAVNRFGWWHRTPAGDDFLTQHDPLFAAQRRWLDVSQNLDDRVQTVMSDVGALSNLAYELVMEGKPLDGDELEDALQTVREALAVVDGAASTLVDLALEAEPRGDFGFHDNGQ